MLTQEQRATTSAMWLARWRGFQGTDVSMAEYARREGFDGRGVSVAAGAAPHGPLGRSRWSAGGERTGGAEKKRKAAVQSTRKRNGLVLWSKRLEQQRFIWPRMADGDTVSMSGGKLNHCSTASMCGHKGIVSYFSSESDEMRKAL